MDVYRIGVTISMVNNASAVLGAIQRDVLRLHQSVDMLTGGFTAAKAAVVGLSAALSGHAALGAMGKLVVRGKELARQQGLMQEQLRHLPAMSPVWPIGRSTHATTQALVATRESGRSNIAEDFRDTREVITASGKSPDAQRNVTFNINARSLIRSMLGDGVQDQSTDPTKVPITADRSQKPNSATLLGPMTKASSLIDPILFTLAQKINASGGSTSIADARNRLQPAFRDLTGGVRQGGPSGASQWWTNTNLPGNHTAQQIRAMFTTQPARFEADSSPNGHASGIGTYNELAQNDPTANIQALRET
jgi:hypothetical protein